MQKTYAAGKGCIACCRMMMGADNYILQFPPGTSATERALIMNALFQVGGGCLGRLPGPPASLPACLPA